MIFITFFHTYKKTNVHKLTFIFNYSFHIFLNMFIQHYQSLIVIIFFNS